MGPAVRLYRAAARSLGADLGEPQAGRVVLSLFFKAVLGIQRIFPFETLDDTGLAILTGGTRVLPRGTLGGLVRGVTLEGVQRLMSQTRAAVKRARQLAVSIDEHTIARFTRKFAITKGFHTIRNKKMKAEKLFFAFEVVGRRLLTLISTPGHGALAEVARRLLPTLRRRARGAELRVVLDAGAAQDHESLLRLVDHPNQVTIVRVPRRQPYRQAWEKLPAEQWTRWEEPGPYQGAPAKVVHLAETRTEFKVD
jgi:hypothetical protein